MKAASGALNTLLNALGSGGRVWRADLYSIVLGATTLRYTSWPTALTVGGNTFLPGPPNFKGGKVTTKVGGEVTTMPLIVTARPTDLINGIPLIRYVLQKGFSGAIVKQETLLMATPGDVSAGTLIRFLGFVGDGGALGRSSVTLECKSMDALMNVRIPSKLMQPSCPYTLFDAGCTLNRASFKVSNAVITGSTVNTINTTLIQSSGYFDQGVIEFTSGANAGFKLSVRAYASQIVTLATPLPNAPTAGDTFDIYPGCDKTQTTCTSKFSNLVNFGGVPFVPQPETAI